MNDPKIMNWHASARFAETWLHNTGGLTRCTSRRNCSPLMCEKCCFIPLLAAMRSAVRSDIFLPLFILAMYAHARRTRRRRRKVFIN